MSVREKIGSAVKSRMPKDKNLSMRKWHFSQFNSQSNIWKRKFKSRPSADTSEFYHKAKSLTILNTIYFP